MKIYKLFLLIIIALASVFPGCIEKPQVGAPTITPTVTPTTMETNLPTAIPTSLTPVPEKTQVLGIPIKYIIWIDSDYGFYRVRAVSRNFSLDLPNNFNILNFTINAGDNVKWMNDDSYDFPLTIVSNEGLWTGRTGLMRYQGEHFAYTFNNTGTYTFSIKEYPDIENQTITVKP